MNTDCTPFLRTCLFTSKQLDILVLHWKENFWVDIVHVVICEMADMKIFVVVALVCCCGTMVLSKEARRGMEVDDDIMHPKRVATAVKQLNSERVKMREMDANEESMHPRRPKKQETANSARHSRHSEMDDAMMHPITRTKSSRTPVKRPNVDIPGDPDRTKMRGVDDQEGRMHPKVSNLKKALPKKVKEEMEEAVMHPRPQNRGSKNAAPAIDREMIRRIDEQESKMHHQVRYNSRKVQNNPRVRRQTDLDGLHPRPANRDQQPIGKSRMKPPQKMDEKLMHPHIAMEIPKDDPAVAFDDEALDYEAILGPDFIHRFDYDDRALHPDNSNSRPRKTPSKEQMDMYENRMHPKRSANTETKPRKSRSLPPRKMDEQLMHPHVAKALPKDDPAVDFDDEEVDVEAVLGPDFIHQFDVDDSMLHPDGGRSRSQKKRAGEQPDL